MKENAENSAVPMFVWGISWEGRLPRWFLGALRTAPCAEVAATERNQVRVCPQPTAGEMLTPRTGSTVAQGHLGAREPGRAEGPALLGKRRQCESPHGDLSGVVSQVRENTAQSSWCAGVCVHAHVCECVHTCACACVCVCACMCARCACVHVCDTQGWTACQGQDHACPQNTVP